MNVIDVNRYVDRRGRFWQKTDVSCEEQGARGQRGDKGATGIGVTGANITNGKLVFSTSDNQTIPVGKMPKKTLKIANLGTIDGANKSFPIVGYNPVSLCINGITYSNSEYTTDGYTITTTFASDDVPTGDVYLFYKEVM